MVCTGSITFIFDHDVALVGEHVPVLTVRGLVCICELSNRETGKYRTVQVEVAIRLVEIRESATISCRVRSIHLKGTCGRDYRIQVVNRRPLIGKSIGSLGRHLGVVSTADAFNLGFYASQAEIAITEVSTERTVVRSNNYLKGLTDIRAKIDAIRSPLFPGYHSSR